MLGNRTIDGTEKLPIYGAFYSFYFRDVSLFESFITLVEKVFSLIRREKHRLLEFYNTRNVEIYVDVASNRKRDRVDKVKRGEKKEEINK